MFEHDHQKAGQGRDQSKYSRSRSPHSKTTLARDGKRRRSRSPQRPHASPYERSRHASHADLPYGVPHLDKHDLKQYQNLFAEYLDVQKGLDIVRLGDHEVKGRWKSFLKKWNSGKLAVGWYDPDRRAQHPHATLHDDVVDMGPNSRWSEAGQDDLALDHGHSNAARVHPESHAVSAEDDYDEIGPTLPSTAHVRGSTEASGPAIHNLSDLQYARESAAEDREAHFSNLRQERKQDRKLQQERVEELVPRSDPGSRERQLEKKREVTAANRAFMNAKESGDAEVDDGDLMGDDGEDVFKRRLKDTQRKKTEREVKREEVLRARRAEREERVREHREKEEKILAGFKELVRARFG